MQQRLFQRNRNRRFPRGGQSGHPYREPWVSEKFRPFRSCYTAFVESDVCGHCVSGRSSRVSLQGCVQRLERGDFFGFADDVLVMATWSREGIATVASWQLATCFNESMVLALAIAPREGINCILNCNSDY